MKLFEVLAKWRGGSPADLGYPDEPDPFTVPLALTGLDNYLSSCGGCGDSPHPGRCDPTGELCEAWLDEQDRLRAESVAAAIPREDAS